MNFQEHPPVASEPATSPAPVALTFVLIGSSIVAALGGFLFGFDTAVISGTTEALRSTYGLSDNLLGFTVAIALIGTIIGSIFAGNPADVWGRRKVLMVLAVLYFVGALGTALAWDWYAFLAFRLLGRAGGWRCFGGVAAVHHGNRPGGCAGVWLRSSSSTSCLASWQRSCRTT